MNGTDTVQWHFFRSNSNSVTCWVSCAQSYNHTTITRVYTPYPGLHEKEKISHQERVKPSFLWSWAVLNVAFYLSLAISTVGVWQLTGGMAVFPLNSMIILVIVIQMMAMVMMMMYFVSDCEAHGLHYSVTCRTGGQGVKDNAADYISRASSRPVVPQKIWLGWKMHRCFVISKQFHASLIYTFVFWTLLRATVGLEHQPEVLCDRVAVPGLDRSYVENYTVTLDFDRTFNHLPLPQWSREDSNDVVKLKSVTEWKGLYQILQSYTRVQ